MRKNWWKILAVVLVLYTIIGGFLIDVPARFILHESIRNLYFHVNMWFSMIIMLLVGVVFSIRYLSSGNAQHDLIAKEAINVGMLLGFLGVITGSLWARFTWGAWWTNDVKLNGAAITMLMYLAYVVLRNSIDEEQKRAKVAAVYNIFAFVMMILFIGILPRLSPSLHPGNGGNPGFNQYDLDGNMRMVFWPSVIAWGLLSTWIMTLKVRISKLNYKLDTEQ